MEYPLQSKSNHLQSQAQNTSQVHRQIMKKNRSLSIKRSIEKLLLLELSHAKKDQLPLKFWTPLDQLVQVVIDKKNEDFNVTFSIILDPVNRGTNQLTSGVPLCGNIITKARLNRRQRTAWGESTSDSMSSSDSSYSKDFPDRLPQKSVDLELGVIGMNANSIDDADDSQSLLNAARSWRQRSAQTRESIRDSENERILEEQFRPE